MVSTRPALRLVLSLSVLGALAAAPSHAAAPPDSAESGAAPRYRLDPVVVTAERMPLALGRIPGDVTVIDGARLERDRPVLVAEALRSVPGIDVQRAGRLGKITDVRLRGADPRHTLVLYDGIPLNGPWVGSFDFADLGAAGASQIEVVGGPASSLYGSGAVGGVIQILGGGVPGTGTVRGFAEVGGEGTWRQGASFRSQQGPRALAIAVSRLTTDGAGTRDAYRGWNATTRAEAALDGNTRLRLTGLLTHGVKELPYDYLFDASGLRQTADPNYEERDRILAGSALLTRTLGAAWALEGEVSGLAGRIVNDNPANEPGGDYQNTRLDNTRWIGAMRARTAIGSLVRVIAGGEYREERVDREDDAQFGGDPYPSSVEQAVHARSLFVQAHAEPHRRLTIGAGLRVEDHVRYGAYGVPRVAAAVSFPEAGLRLRGGYGRAFTAPTLTDLYYPGYGADTLSLRPERSRNWEAGADGRWLDGRVEAHVTWHRTRFFDLIQSNSFYQTDNVGRATVEGKEVSVRVRPTEAMALGWRVAHLPVAKNDATGERLGKRPRWRTGADLDVRASRTLRLLLSWRWSDPFHDPFDFVDVSGRLLDGDTPGYATLDLGAVVTPPRGPLAVRVRLENALDRDIQEVKGLPARGRSLLLALDVRH